MPFRPVLLLTAALLFIGVVRMSGQQDSFVYKGLRVSLFGFEVLKQRTENISLRMKVANTGRLPVSFGKRNSPPPEALIIELDTVNLPVVLLGHEQMVADAVRSKKVDLEPGEMMDDLKVEITLKVQKPDPVASTPASYRGQCTDLVFDTAYIVEYTDDRMVLQYVIRNGSNRDAYVLGNSDSESDNLAVNVYFVSGTRLTRGAILADGIFIQQGRETLDGVLMPGQILQGAIRISLKSRTKFTPNILLELDPFQKMYDCDRTNNTELIEVRF
ncbi:MAG: hypothetical protein KDC70_16035 [Saprospiraceae bacterium]|nr:hypothetical protein [Saprospiraceae bacterium]